MTEELEIEGRKRRGFEQLKEATDLKIASMEDDMAERKKAMKELKAKLKVANDTIAELSSRLEN
jgi:hypothetical protein